MRDCIAYRLALAAFVGMGALASHASAQQSLATFYEQNGLKIVVAYGAGGGYDVYARVLQRHIGAHMPGKTNVVVQNMPGAAGITAMNWTYNSAPKDGSTILATYSALLDANIIGNSKARFDIRKFNWIGSIASSPLVCITWHTSPYKDIRQMIGKPLSVSATGSSGKSATVPILLNETLGTQLKVIAGYSTSETTLALERGEVDAICGIGFSTLQASNPDWVQNRRVNVVAQAGLMKLDALNGVPNVLDLVTGENHDLFEYGAIMEAMGRPYLAPPGVPAERLAAVRKAFDETMKDPAFNEDIEKLRLNVSPMTGDEMQQWIEKLYTYSPATIARVAKLNGEENQ